MRLKSIEKILTECNYVYSIFTPSQFIKNKADLNFELGVISSFTNSWIAPWLKHSTSRLWLDAMDSKTMLRKTRARSFQKQFVANIRDFMGTMSAYDLITFISEQDQSQEKGNYTSSHNLVFPIKPDNLPAINPSEIRKFVFVGPARYKPNLDAVGLLNQLLMKNLIKVPIEIYGEGYNTKKSNWHELINFKGFVQEKFLYSTSDVHLAPLFSGAGIKMKVVIPFALGLQVIGTNLAFNGLNSHPNLIEIDSIENLPEAVLHLDLRHKAEAPALDSIFTCDQTAQITDWLLNY